MIKSQIVGSSDRQVARVDPNFNLQVQKAPYPPYGGDSIMRVFRQYLTDDGTATGSNDMLVDGSSTNVPFYVLADPDDDIYISRLSFVIADASASLNQFGNIAALTNGCALSYMDQKGTVTIHEALKTNWDFIRLCQGSPAFGATTDAFRASNVSSTSEGYIPTLDVKGVFGFEWGLRLAAGTTQRLEFKIRDNVSGLDQLDAIAYGFTRGPDA